MRVICIDTPQNETPGKQLPGPVEGDIDDVLADFQDDDGEFLYVLARFGWGIGYSQYHFIPLSSIDETELIAQREGVEA